MNKDLFFRIEDYCDRTGISRLLENSFAVTVGFSGGADSVFLLSYLKERLPSEKKLVALHLNHMLRGAEADRDEAFCRSFCEEKDIDFVSKKADVYKISEAEKQGIEECARNQRYLFFDECRKEIAKKHSVAEETILTATAHNADDNMETVLFNAARGSGALGLCGIPPVRDGVIIRPVLCISSEEIRSSLKAAGQAFVFDFTNAEDEYTRNRIRHRVVPALKEINPSVEKAFLRLSEALRCDEAYFQNEAAMALGENRRSGEAKTDCLRGLPRSVLVRALFMLYSEVSRDGALSGKNLDDIISFIENCKKGELHLPDHVTVRIDENMIFCREKNKTKEKIPSYKEPLKDGINEFSCLGFVLSICDINNSPLTEGQKDVTYNINGNIYNYLIKTELNNDKIIGSLYVRNRREGDTYFIGGHHKKVKKLFCDSKVPAFERDKIPLVCDDEGILWIPGFPARDGTAFKGDGESLKIKYYYKKEN